MPVRVKVGLVVQPKPPRAKSKWVIQQGAESSFTEHTWNRCRPVHSEDLMTCHTACPFLEPANTQLVSTERTRGQIVPVLYI